MSDTDPPSAASTLIADLAEFDTPASSTPNTAPDAQPDAAPADDFLAAFDDVLKPGAEEKPDPPPAKEEPAGNQPPAKEEPAAGDDDVPEEPPKWGSATAKKDWSELRANNKRLKGELEAERNKLKEHVAELEKLRKEAAALPELSEKAKLAEEAERELAIARVEGTREYKETVLAPLEAIEKMAASIAKANEIKLDDILDVLTEPDPVKQGEALDELVGGLKTVDQLRVVRMAEDSRALLLKREQIRERAAEARKELEQRTAAKEQQARKEARAAFEKAVDHAVGGLRERVPFVPLAEGETEEGVFGALLDKARGSDFDSASENTKAVASVATLLLPRVTRQLVKAMADAKKLEARIAELTKTKVTVASTPATTDTGRDDDDFMGGMQEFLGLQRSHPINVLLEQ